MSSYLLDLGIGTTRTDWYEPLKHSVDADLQRLQGYGWWWIYARWQLEILADAIVAMMTVAVLVTYANIV